MKNWRTEFEEVFKQLEHEEKTKLKSFIDKWLVRSYQLGVIEGIAEALLIFKSIWRKKQTH